MTRRSREQHVFAPPAIDEEHEQGELAQHILERGYLAHLTLEALKKIACELLSTDKKQAGLGLVQDTTHEMALYMFPTTVDDLLAKSILNNITSIDPVTALSEIKMALKHIPWGEAHNYAKDALDDLRVENERIAVQGKIKQLQRDEVPLQDSNLSIDVKSSKEPIALLIEALGSDRQVAKTDDTTKINQVAESTGYCLALRSRRRELNRCSVKIKESFKMLGGEINCLNKILGSIQLIERKLDRLANSFFIYENMDAAKADNFDIIAMWHGDELDPYVRGLLASLSPLSPFDDAQIRNAFDLGPDINIRDNYSDCVDMVALGCHIEDRYNQAYSDKDLFNEEIDQLKKSITECRGELEVNQDILYKELRSSSEKTGVPIPEDVEYPVDEYISDIKSWQKYLSILNGNIRENFWRHTTRLDEIKESLKDYHSQHTSQHEQRSSIMDHIQSDTNPDRLTQRGEDLKTTNAAALAKQKGAHPEVQAAKSSVTSSVVTPKEQPKVPGQGGTSCRPGDIMPESGRKQRQRQGQAAYLEYLLLHEEEAAPKTRLVQMKVYLFVLAYSIRNRSLPSNRDLILAR